MRVVISFIVTGLIAVILMLSIQKFYGIAPVSQTGKVAHSFDLSVDTASDTELDIRAIQSGDVLATFEKGTFAYSVFRNMRSDRKRSRAPVESPFRLVRYETGDLALKDLETGASVYIKAFGPSNAEAFDKLFDASMSRSE